MLLLRKKRATYPTGFRSLRVKASAFSAWPAGEATRGPSEQPPGVSTLVVCQLWLTPSERLFFPHFLLKHGFVVSTKVVTRAALPFLLSLCNRVKHQGFTRCAARVAWALLSFSPEGGKDNDDFQENYQSWHNGSPAAGRHHHQLSLTPLLLLLTLSPRCLSMKPDEDGPAGKRPERPGGIRDTTQQNGEEGNPQLRGRPRGSPRRGRRGYMIVECPACHTRYRIESAEVLDDSTFFECPQDGCRHVFPYSPPLLWGRGKVVPFRAPLSASPTKKVQQEKLDEATARAALAVGKTSGE